MLKPLDNRMIYIIIGKSVHHNIMDDISKLARRAMSHFFKNFVKREILKLVKFNITSRHHFIFKWHCQPISNSKNYYVLKNFIMWPLVKYLVEFAAMSATGRVAQTRKKTYRPGETQTDEHTFRRNLHYH